MRKRKKKTIILGSFPPNTFRFSISTGVGKCPYVSHHPTISDISSPTDIWFGDVQNPRKGTSIPTPDLCWLKPKVILVLNFDVWTIPASSGVDLGSAIFSNQCRSMQVMVESSPDVIPSPVLNTPPKRNHGGSVGNFHIIYGSLDARHCPKSLKTSQCCH